MTPPKTTYSNVTGIILTLMALCHLFFIPNANSGPALVNKIGMQFVKINPGSFIMGSPQSEMGRKWDERLHQVILTRGYYMSITEVTQNQWIRVMESTPSFFQGCGGDCPVESVSFDQCQEFIRVLNYMEKTDKYRLPTEAEWEYACRAGSRTAFTDGDITVSECGLDPNLDPVGWYCGNSGVREPVIYKLSPQTVALKKPNDWGLFDMHGNVNEWVLDACKPRGMLHTGTVTETYNKDKITDPLSVKGPNRIFRGGSWNTSTRYCRAANRGSFKPTAKRSYIGFRVVKTL
ncbi:MAG: formylglycine-generating enzyme family protein [Proteobacteria bacterium]|nr:formylglycine-generating enzyme family protein [Pseudomonadota bacterium]